MSMEYDPEDEKRAPKLYKVDWETVGPQAATLLEGADKTLEFLMEVVPTLVELSSAPNEIKNKLQNALKISEEFRSRFAIVLLRSQGKISS